MTDRVLVLNQSYEPLNLCGVRRAVGMVYTKRATVLHTRDGVLRSERDAMPHPAVIRLRRFIPFRRNGVPLTRKNVLRRDGYRCQYCGRGDAALTIDHLVPRTVGGGDSWANLVTACKSCNARKGGRTLESAGMRLIKRPRRPSYFQLLLPGGKVPHDSWRSYLFL